MAIRLDKAFGGTADAWLALQTAYDLAQAKKMAKNIIVKRYVARQRCARWFWAAGGALAAVGRPPVPPWSQARTAGDASVSTLAW